MESPQISREFPSEIMSLLVLRSSMLDGGRVMTSSDSPECDGDGLSIGDTFLMALCSLIVDHGAVANGMFCVC